MHQQIRSRVRTSRSQDDSEGGGTLAELLESVRAFNLTVAGFSAAEPDVFVMAVDHEEDPDATKKCLDAIHPKFRAEPRDLTEGHDCKELEHVEGALLEALRSMDALDAAEVLIGCTRSRRYFVQVLR